MGTPITAQEIVHIHQSLTYWRDQGVKGQHFLPKDVRQDLNEVVLNMAFIFFKREFVE